MPSLAHLHPHTYILHRLSSRLLPRLLYDTHLKFCYLGPLKVPSPASATVWPLHSLISFLYGLQDDLSRSASKYDPSDELGLVTII